MDFINGWVLILGVLVVIFGFNWLLISKARKGIKLDTPWMKVGRQIRTYQEELRNKPSDYDELHQLMSKIQEEEKRQSEDKTE